MKINKENFFIVAEKHYDNPVYKIDRSVIHQDLKIFVYLKRALIRKDNKGASNRLILNFVITLFNLFGEATCDLIFFKLEEKYWSTLVVCLVYLNKMPDKIPNTDLKVVDYPLDMEMLEYLKNL